MEHLKCKTCARKWQPCPFEGHPDYNRFCEHPRQMSALNPDRKFLPGYTGYWTGKRFDIGKTIANASKDDLNYYGEYYRARNNLLSKPNSLDWLPNDIPPREPEKPRIDGYDRYMPRHDKPLPGNTKFVPGAREEYGGTYGTIAAECLRRHELANIKPDQKVSMPPLPK